MIPKRSAALCIFTLSLASTASAQSTPSAAGSASGDSVLVPVAPPTPAASATPAPGDAKPPPAETPAPAAVGTASSSPPTTLGERETEAAARPSWFSRAPLTLAVGQGAKTWRLTLYGFIEFDAIQDSTRSFDDSIGNTNVARNETYAGQVGRTQFSIRNTRLGLLFVAPVIGGVKGSAVLETDFFGPQSSPPTVSEGTFFDNPTLRVRHAYLKVEDPYVDVVAGQTYYLFGWQNYFFPCTLEYLGLPNEAFGRAPQVRLQHTFATRVVSADIAFAAMRPVQRDSEVPDLNAGLRLSLNDWKGITTPGNVGTVALPLSIGVSGAVRQFKVDSFTEPPPQGSNSATGWGISLDALLPIIPAHDGDDRGNRLTLTGSFVLGTGIADLVNTGGGASFPTLPNPAMISPAPLYAADVDNGLVTFDTTGVLHTIDWQTFMVGLQYYLPPNGRFIVSGNFTEGYSSNMASLYPKGGAEIGLATKVAYLSRYADANVFFDVLPMARIGASFQYSATEYIDGELPRNLRWMASALYLF